MSPLSYAPLRADAADDDDVSTSPPETLTVSTVAATAVGVGHHLLKVEGYSRLKRIHGDNGSCLESAEFGAGGHTWRVHCCLNGDGEENAGFISLFGTLVSAAGGGGDSVVHAELAFALLRHHGGAFERWRTPAYAHRGCARPFRVRGKDNSWGFPEFISTKDLEGSSFLRDDCFAVLCTVTVVEGRGAAAEGEVKVEDMDRMGLVCACEDDACKLKHERPAETLWEEIALFCRLLCGEASS